MRFPNAFKGVSKIYSAEILMLIGGIITVIALILFAVTGATESLGPGVVGLVLLLVAAVLSIIALIRSIGGINSASLDEPTFKSAMLWLIIGIVASVLEGALQSSSESLSSLISILGEFASVMSTVYVIKGVIALADKMGNAEVASLGHKTLKLITTVYLIAIVISVVSLVLRLVSGGEAASETADVIAAVLAIVAGVVDIIGYILYLKMLAKGKAMLAE